MHSGGDRFQENRRDYRSRQAGLLKPLFMPADRIGSIDGCYDIGIGRARLMPGLLCPARPRAPNDREKNRDAQPTP